MRKVTKNETGRTIDIDSIGRGDLVIYKGFDNLYKMHKERGGVLFSFMSLSNGACRANGSYGSLKQLLQSVDIGKLYVLDNIFEITELENK